VTKDSRILRRFSIVFVALQIFLLVVTGARWPLDGARAQDDPWQWPADQKVEKATERLKDLKESAQQFSRRDCPSTRVGYDAWLEEALDLVGSLVGLQDSTRQIRKTGAGADKLQAWDTVRTANGPGDLTELMDLFGRCGRRVTESDATFRPPGQEEIIRRASFRIAEKKRSELAAIGIALEEQDEPKIR